MSAYLDGKQIGDKSPLATLASITKLWFVANRISDIRPLVQDEGLATRDEVYLAGKPPSSGPVNTYIPELEARGVIVRY